MTRARTLADMISDGVIGTTELADDAITPVKLDETGTYSMAGLTVDTNTLHVDSANNRVGIGTTSPASMLDIKGSTGNSKITLNSALAIDTYPSIGKLSFYSNDNSTNSSGEVGSIETIGIGTWNGAANNAAMTFNLIQGLAGTTSPVEAMRISSGGNVGIGTAPASGVALHIDDATDPTLRLQRDGAAYSQFSSDSGGSLFIRADEGNTGSSSRLQLDVDSNEIMRLDGGNVIVNEQSRDIDFRVESDNQTHALFVDASTDRVGIGSSSPDSKLDLFLGLTTSGDYITTGNTNRFGNGLNKLITFKHGYNTPREVAAIAVNTVSSSPNIDGRGDLYFYTGTSGASDGGSTSTQRLRIDYAGNVVFNETGANADFRVESDTNANALFIDASSDVVDISTNAVAHDSATKLQVSGRVRFGSGFGSETSGMTTPTNSMILTKESFSATSGATRIYGLSAQNSGYTTTGSSAPMAVLLGGWSNGSSYSGGIEYQPSSKELHIMGGTANAQTSFVDAGRLASFGQTQVVYNGGNQNYSDNYRQYAYSESVSSLFNNTTNGQAQQITVGNYLPYQHSIPVVVAFSYNGNGALTYTKFLLVQNDFNSITVQELYTNQSSTGIIQSVTFNTTGSYNTRRLQITAQPASGYPMNVWNCVVYYGVAFH